MRLDYSSIERYSFMSDYQDTMKQKASFVVQSIKNRIELQSKKQEQIDNLTYEKNLIVNDIVELIKEDLTDSAYNIFFGILIADAMHRAWNYHRALSENKLDTLSYKDYNDKEVTVEDFEISYNFVLNEIKRRLIPEKYHKKLKVIEITMCNYGARYSWKFKIDGVEFMIEVPIFSYTNKDNYIDMLAGYELRQEIMEYEHVGTITLEFYEIDPEAFKTKLEKWLDNKIASSVLDKSAKKAKKEK